MATQDELIEALETTANFMRGTNFDVRIPSDVRTALKEKALKLEALVEAALESNN